jgi:hypothetical protein
MSGGGKQEVAPGTEEETERGRACSIATHFNVSK